MLRRSSASCAERMKIPVFHDDQHGTAIIVGAALLNGLQRRRQADRRGEARRARRRRGGARVPRPAGRARRAAREHLGRRTSRASSTKAAPRRWTTTRRATPRTRRRARSPRSCRAPTCSSACRRRGVLKPEWLPSMAARPLIFALANPKPEIMPELAKAARPDAVIATGRSDYPNQVNNVLCFPFIFRGALDVGATHHQRGDEARGGARDRRPRRGPSSPRSSRTPTAAQDLAFGPEYLIPKPFDPRLIVDDRAGGRQGGDGLGRRHAPDRRLRRLSRTPQRRSSTTPAC